MAVLQKGKVLAAQPSLYPKDSNWFFRCHNAMIVRKRPTIQYIHVMLIILWKTNNNLHAATELSICYDTSFISLPVVEIAKVACDMMRPSLLEIEVHRGVQCHAEHMMEVPACSRHTEGLGATTEGVAVTDDNGASYAVAVVVTVVDDNDIVIVAEGLVRIAFGVVDECLITVR